MTISEKVKEEVKSYMDSYRYLSKSDKLKDKAESLILSEACVQKVIAESVLNELREIFALAKVEPK